MNKIVVYTCITGNYDTLAPVRNPEPNVDFVFFTDNPKAKVVGWTTRPIPEILKNLSNVKKQRLIKICPHKYLPEYEYSIWQDGNIILRYSPTKLVEKLKADDHCMLIRKHPIRKCIYDEERAVLRAKRDRPEVTNPQMERYREEGFPKKFGLVESCIIVREDHVPECEQLMLDWSNELLQGSHRDQLSFNYVCWKNNIDYGILNDTYENHALFTKSRKHLASRK